MGNFENVSRETFFFCVKVGIYDNPYHDYLEKFILVERRLCLLANNKVV